jgi:hypothetical protein
MDAHGKFKSVRGPAGSCRSSSRVRICTASLLRSLDIMLVWRLMSQRSAELRAELATLMDQSDKLLAELEDVRLRMREVLNELGVSSQIVL